MKPNVQAKYSHTYDLEIGSFSFPVGLVAFSSFTDKVMFVLLTSEPFLFLESGSWYLKIKAMSSCSERYKCDII